MCLKVILTGMVTIRVSFAVGLDRTASLSNGAPWRPSVLIAGDPWVQAKGTLVGAAVERRIRGMPSMNAARSGRRVVEALRDPAAYPHAVDAPVRLRRDPRLLGAPDRARMPTRSRSRCGSASSIIPRPNAGGSLCEEELRLNRRLAPDLYLDVVPIVRDSPTGLRVGDGLPAGRRARACAWCSSTPRDELDALLERAPWSQRAGLARRSGSARHARHGADRAGRPAASARRPRCSRITLDNFVEIAPPGRAR